MKTYNSFEAAKIANPESDIYKLMGVRDFVFTAFGVAYGELLQPCNPANHCVTVEKFLTDGHRLAMGDIVINSSGAVVDMNYSRSLSDFGVLNSASHKEFILRAAALEEKPSEKVEWVNGDELPPVGWCGLTSYTNDDCDNWCEFHEGVVMGVNGDYVWMAHHGKFQRVHHIGEIEFKELETKQQREDRERLENGKAFYGLMSEIEISVMDPEDNGYPNQWDELRNEWQQVYILQAEKLNYLKESK